MKIFDFFVDFLYDDYTCFLGQSLFAQNCLSKYLGIVWYSYAVEFRNAVIYIAVKDGKEELCVFT